MPVSKEPKVSAILLAAGESRRMGPENKLFLDWDGEPMLIRSINQLKSAGIHELIVVLNPENKFRLDAFHVDDIKEVINLDYKKGMTTSIQRGVLESDPDTDGFMICMSDQPLLSSFELDQLISEFSQNWPQDDHCIVVPFHEGRKGNPVIFSSEYKKSILDHEEMEGCKGIVKENRSHVHQVQVNSRAIHLDVDTPEDYRRNG
jgi:molybdenum cofactor cytidylyltransferase